MEIDDPKIVALREKVTAAQQEFDMAIAFHEIWKPTAYDKNLHSRMGRSYLKSAEFSPTPCRLVTPARTRPATVR